MRLLLLQVRDGEKPSDLDRYPEQEQTYKPILINMAKVGVSESWITTLGVLKAAGGLGLLIGIGVPAVGIA
jgi:hypothetical protein